MVIMRVVGKGNGPGGAPTPRDPAHRKGLETVDDVTVHEIEAEECFYCLGSSYHFIGSIDGEGEEIIEAYACKRCGS
jgi:hypothetical protein